MFSGGYAVDNEAMVSLFDENVLFENLQELHLVGAVKEEVGSVDDFACVEREYHDGHHQQIACGNEVCFLSHQNYPLSIA